MNLAWRNRSVDSRFVNPNADFLWVNVHHLGVFFSHNFNGIISMFCIDLNLLLLLLLFWSWSMVAASNWQKHWFCAECQVSGFFTCFIIHLDSKHIWNKRKKTVELICDLKFIAPANAILLLFVFIFFFLEF